MKEEKDVYGSACREQMKKIMDTKNQETPVYVYGICAVFAAVILALVVAICLR